MKDQGLTPEPKLGRGKPSPKQAVPTRAPSGPSLRTQGIKPGSRKKIPNNKAGPTGSSRAQAKRAAKKAPPIPMMVVAGIAVVVALVLVPRAYQPGTEASVHVRRSINASAGTPTTVVSRPQETTQAAAPKMNLTPAAQITLDQISSYEGGQQPMIRFYDGSTLRVDPVTLQALRPEVRLRLTYTRSRP